MKPPEATQATQTGAGEPQPAVSVCLPDISVMKTRRQFLACNSGKRQGTKAFLLQARNRRDDSAVIHVGFTCSKKVGNAVARNRAKRRLREIARLVLPGSAQNGWDYVLIGRADTTANHDFEKLQADLRWALMRVHGGMPDRPARKTAPRK